MFGNNSRPKWWLLYLLVPVMIGLFLVEGSEPLSSTGHRIVELAVVFVTFGMVALWLHSNEAGIRREQWTEYRRTTYTSAGRIITIRHMDGETADSAPVDARAAIETAKEPAVTGQKGVRPVALPGEKAAEPAGARVLARTEIASLTDRRA